ncbi:MAG: archaeosortase/exosortase family protein [Cyanobacteriota bacterium]
MKSSLQAMALPNLLARWRSLDNRDLWGLLAAIFALYLMQLSLLTQLPDVALNLVLVMGGAVLVLNGPPAGWQPRPGRIGRWVGVALLVALIWFGQRLMSSDFISSLLPLLAGMAIALLAAPASKLRPFLKSLCVLALLPVVRAVGTLTPLGPLSVATAWLAKQMVSICGYTAVQLGTLVKLQGGGVIVSGNCAGLGILLQLLRVAVIFALAFPMRHRWQNGLMIMVAPFLGMVVNGMRITLLALFVTSGLPNRQWWFEFFHDHWGSLLFSGLGMQLFVWFYVYWMARQVAALGTR